MLNDLLSTSKRFSIFLYPFGDVHVFVCMCARACVRACKLCRSLPLIEHVFFACEISRERERRPSSRSRVSLFSRSAYTRSPISDIGTQCRVKEKKKSRVVPWLQARERKVYRDKARFMPSEFPRSIPPSGSSFPGFLRTVYLSLQPREFRLAKLRRLL